MKPDLFGIYDDYADGYCEAAPPSALPHFYHADGSVTFARLPGYPEYEMVFDQAVDTTAGKDTYGYAPFAQEMLIKLTWPRMFKADKENLEVFYQDVVQGTAKQFTYSNNQFGPAQPVRFAGPLPSMPEVAFEQYEVSITLRVALNYPQMPISGVAPPGSGNRFIIGNFVVQIPVGIMGNSGCDLSKYQSEQRDSAGDLVIYDLSRLVHRQHRMTVNHDYSVFLALQVLFFSFVHGCAQKITWIDQDETSRVIRLSHPSITIRQKAYDQFETELNLLEELAP